MVSGDEAQERALALRRNQSLRSPLMGPPANHQNLNTVICITVIVTDYFSTNK